MDDCTRPSHISRQTREPARSRLAALFFASALSVVAFAAPALPATQQDLPPENEETASISPSADHEVAIQFVKPGQEMAILSARLTDRSSGLAKGVAWTVRNAEGETVFEDTMVSAAMGLEPGYYAVEARYGAVVLQESFTLLEAQAVNISFVFNAGALRILPRLKGLTPADITTRTRIFALTGKAKGNLVHETSKAGEVVNLVAGNYRVESKLEPGNTVVVADVRVQPGLMSAIEIDHRAGLARLAFVGAPDARVEWEIKRGPLTEISRFTGLNASLALRPGTYTAVARVGGESLSATFEIEEGKARDIMLGN